MERPADIRVRAGFRDDGDADRALGRQRRWHGACVGAGTVVPVDADWVGVEVEVDPAE